MIKVQAEYTITTYDEEYNPHEVFIRLNFYDAERDEQHGWWIVVDEYGSRQLFCDKRFKQEFLLICQDKEAL